MKRPRYKPVPVQRAAAAGKLRAATTRGARKARVQPAQPVTRKRAK